MKWIWCQLCCMCVWMCVAACGRVCLTVLYSIFCDQDWSPVQTTTFFFPSAFILRKLQLQITNNCMGFTGATEGISVSSTTVCRAVPYCIWKCSLSFKNVGQVMKLFNAFHSFFSQKERWPNSVFTKCVAPCTLVCNTQPGIWKM